MSFQDFWSRLWHSYVQARKERRKTTCVAVLGVQRGVKDPCPNCPNQYCICNPKYKQKPTAGQVI